MYCPARQRESDSCHVVAHRTILIGLTTTASRRLAVTSVLVIMLTIGGMAEAGSSVSGSTSNQQETENYAETTCPFAEEIISALGTSLSCAVLNVPLVHGVEDGAPIKLSIARIRSSSESPATVPLVMLLGGPGQEVESILPLFASDGEQSYRPLLERQDVILMDQRGVGYSEPSLACAFDAVGGIRVPAQLLNIDDPVPAFADCADTLRAASINLEAFDSVQSAADVNLLRRALGIEQVDLLGTSYGSRLALTVMRDFPGTIRSAILESPEPLQVNLVAGLIVGFDRALSRLFAQCEQDDPCRSRYPDLNQSFATAVDDLNVDPLTLAVTNLGSGAAESVDIDGTTFAAMVYFATFSGPLLPFVPALIDGIRTGDNVVLENIAPYTLGSSSGLSLGASYVINCNDELGFTSEEDVRTVVAEAGVRPQIADGRFAGALQIFDICAEIDVSPADPVENQPVASDVPVLFLTGAFDPITPPSYADLALASLPNGHAVTFSNGSHAPLSTSGTCGFGIVAAFLDNPATTPDVSCSPQSQVEFLVLPR